MQRTVGNRATTGVLAKLAVGHPGDALEIEADRVAERVMGAAEPAWGATAAGSAGAVLHRKCATCEDEDEIHRKAEGAPGGGAAGPAIVHDVLRSPGQPLDAATRAFMEPRFGHDFGAVRVHVDAPAAASARAVNALAYTVGSDIAFAEGRYAPHTRPGAQLLAHELAHVTQASAGGERVIRRATTFFGPTAGAPADWDKKVNAATSSTDRVALVKTATGLTVNDATSASSGDASPTAAHLTEYTNANQTINYDDGLNAKKSPVDKRSLAQNAGYTLQSSGKYYIILGRKALDPTRYYETVEVLSHEFDHVRQGLAGSTLKGNESEVDAWTSSFVRDFHRTYLLADNGSTCFVQSVATWTPLLDYYSRSSVSQTQRDAAAKRIEDYYKATLKPHAGHTAAFKFWVHRSLKVSVTPNLADTLNTDLTLGINASDSLATTRQFPCGSLKSLSYTPPTLDKATLPSPATTKP